MTAQIIDLFAGIGGFSIAGHKAGHKTVLFCEIEHYQTKVLNKNFPGVPVHDDIKTLDKQKLLNYGWKEEEPTIITGGFPCQPFSFAGARKGTEDDRHLWGEMFRIIEIVKPVAVISENVLGIVNIQDGMVFNTVCADLESAGYFVTVCNIPAAGKNAPHKRERIWFVAHTNKIRNGFS